VQEIQYIFIDQSDKGLERKKFHCPYKALNPTSRKMYVLLTRGLSMTLSIPDNIWSQESAIKF